MNFAEIEKEINTLAKKANSGALSMDEMAGGTFTISNGGVYGSLLSTPIINPPQVCEVLLSIQGLGSHSSAIILIIQMFRTFNYDAYLFVLVHGMHRILLKMTILMHSQLSLAVSNFGNALHYEPADGCSRKYCCQANDVHRADL